MLINKNIAISTTKILLVPYETRHVETYHEWMKDPEIQELTASEPLSLDEEYAMQRSWRNDHDKLTFISCRPLGYDAQRDMSLKLKGGDFDKPDQMIGDVNLFLSKADEDEEGVIGEFEVMIASAKDRGQGLGRSTVLAFLHYIEVNVSTILSEYAKGKGLKKAKLLQLMVKIGSDNKRSIELFESIGFIKIHESPNYFGEVELAYEWCVNSLGSENSLKRSQIDRWRELPYENQEQ